MRASIYARFSTDLQREASIEDQQRVARQYAEQRGWEVAEECVFSDRAISGATAARPGYQAMIAAAKAGRFDVLVVDDFSRLSRDQEESHRLVKRLRYWEVGLVAVADGVDTTSSPRNAGLLVGIKGAIAEQYVADLAAKTHRGIAGRVLKGMSGGGLPYGYTSEPVYAAPPRLDRYGKPVAEGYRRVIIPEQAEIVHRIFTRYAEGASSREIVEELNRDGVPPPGARWRNRRGVAATTWSHTTVESGGRKRYGIVNNSLYRGLLVWNKAEWRHNPESPDGRRVPRLRPESEWITTEVPELRIVSDELWEAVKSEQQRRREGRRFGSTRAPRHLLSGLLRCGLCGGRMGARGRHGYGCLTRVHRGKHLCSNTSAINRQALETLVLEAVKEQLFGKDSIADLVRMVREELLADPRLAPQRSARAAAAQKAVAEKRREVEAVTASLRRSRSAKRNRAAEHLEADLERLLTEAEELERRLPGDDDNGLTKRLNALLAELPERVRAYVEDLSSKLSGTAAGHTGDIGLGEIISEIIVSPPREGRDHFIVVVRGMLTGALHLLPGGKVVNKMVAGVGFLPRSPGRPDGLPPLVSEGRYRLPAVTGLRPAEIERLAIAAAREGAVAAALS